MIMQSTVALFSFTVKKEPDDEKRNETSIDEHKLLP